VLERLAGTNADKQASAGVSASANASARSKQFKDAAKPLLDSLTAVENELIQTKLKSSQDILNFPPRLDNKLVSLASYVSSADSKPTKAALATFAELSARVDKQLARLKPLMETELPKFNKLAQDQNLPAVLVE
jgi:hypothetical protein